MNTQTIQAEARAEAGKGVARKLRASGLFDASRVSDQTLKTSVRDWYLSRGIRRVCPVSEWDGHFCNFALNAQSYNRIRRLWRNTPPAVA